MPSLAQSLSTDPTGAAALPLREAHAVAPTYAMARFHHPSSSSYSDMEQTLKKQGCHLQWKIGAPIATRTEGSLENPTIVTIAAQACHSGSYQCGYVIKYERNRQVMERELEMYKLARGRGLIRERVVPHLYDGWWCENMGHLVLERIDVNVFQLGQLQFLQWMNLSRPDMDDMNLQDKNKLLNSLLFTADQLQGMWQLATLMDRIGLVHGDLKLSNILYRIRDQRFYIFDFGFSGFVIEPSSSSFLPVVGWSATYGAPTFTRIPSELYPIFNRWQLLMALTDAHPVLVALPNSDHAQYRFGFEEIGVFAGFRSFEFTPDQELALQRFMPDYPNFPRDFHVVDKDVTEIRKRSFSIRSNHARLRDLYVNKAKIPLLQVDLDKPFAYSHLVANPPAAAAAAATSSPPRSAPTAAKRRKGIKF